MYINKQIEPKPYWGFANELDGRDLDLGYPTNLVKAVKNFFYTHGVEGILSAEKIVLHIKYHGEYFVEPLRNNAAEALKFYMANKPISNSPDDCPSSRDITNLFMEHDKYFHMIVTLSDMLPAILNAIKNQAVSYAALDAGILVRMYNNEVFELINQYLYSKARCNTKNKTWEYYYINGNIGYAVDSSPYIAIIVYKAICYEGLTWEVESESVELETLYENYNVLNNRSFENKIKPSGSFLVDCKKITAFKKEVLKSYSGSLDFHDLMTYGPYNDRILSIENMQKISEIFNHSNWIPPFFLYIALYCDNYVKIGTDENSEVKSLIPLNTSLVDPSRLQNFNLFLQAVEYFDSIYDEIIDKPE